MKRTGAAVVFAVFVLLGSALGWVWIQFERQSRRADDLERQLKNPNGHTHADDVIHENCRACGSDLDAFVRKVVASMSAPVAPAPAPAPADKLEKPDAKNDASKKESKP